MSKLSMFNFITLNGFFKGPGGDLSWHKHGGEEEEYSKEGLASGNILVFGRVTYEMMAGYWPTPMARQNSPVVADAMNKAEKIVVTHSLKKTEWNNASVLKGDLVSEMKKLKSSGARDMTILGSGSIVNQLAAAGLIDHYSIMIDPVTIAGGTPILDKVSVDLRLAGTRTFKSGTVLLEYVPA